MIETKRLIIKSLTYEQVKKYVLLGDLLEDELRLKGDSRVITAELKNAIEKYTLKWIEDNPDNILFCTMWIVIEKESNITVGDLSFKGPPSENGEIEIGYGTQIKHRSKGFMKEAVDALADWALEQPVVKSVLAETHKDNLASIIILKKNGFEFRNENGDMLWWVKKNKST